MSETAAIIVVLVLGTAGILLLVNGGRQPLPRHALLCPSCGSPGPFARIAMLYDVSADGAEAHELGAGARYACQRCPQVFAGWRDGVFIPHAESLPFVPVPYRGSPRVSDGIPASELPPQSPPPTPRARPRA